MSNVVKQQLPKGYQQTEVGILPKNWELTTIDDVVKRGWLDKPLDGNHGDIHPKSGDFVSSGIPFIMANNVQSGKVNIENCSFIRKEQADSLQKGFSKTGDVLLTHKATIGNTAVVGLLPCEYIMLTPQVTYYRVLKSEAFNNHYLRHYMDGNIFQTILDTNSGGGTRSYIGITAQRQLPIVIPPLKEQTAIANALSDVDALITSLEKFIAKKRAIKTAAMQQLLTGKKRLPPFDKTHTGYKQTELGEIPEDWEVISLGDVARFYKGRGLPKSDLVVGGHRECIHYGELFTLYEEVIEDVISCTNANFDVFVSTINDVLMPTSDVTPNGLATASSIKKEGVILGGDVLIIRAPEVILDSSFFAYLISISKDQIMQLVSGSTVYHLYGSDMATFKFAKPAKVQEQVAIANILLDMTKEMSVLELRLKKTQQLKQGMMQELLTGRTRLV